MVISYYIYWAEHNLSLSLSLSLFLSDMSVLLETSLGDIVVDLFVDAAPKLCEK